MPRPQELHSGRIERPKLFRSNKNVAERSAVRAGETWGSFEADVERHRRLTLTHICSYFIQFPIIPFHSQDPPLHTQYAPSENIHPMALFSSQRANITACMSFARRSISDDNDDDLDGAHQSQHTFDRTHHGRHIALPFERSSRYSSSLFAAACAPRSLLSSRGRHIALKSLGRAAVTVNGFSGPKTKPTARRRRSTLAHFPNRISPSNYWFSAESGSSPFAHHFRRRPNGDQFYLNRTEMQSLAAIFVHFLSSTAADANTDNAINLNQIDMLLILGSSSCTRCDSHSWRNPIRKTNKANPFDLYCLLGRRAGESKHANCFGYLNNKMIIIRFLINIDWKDGTFRSFLMSLKRRLLTKLVAGRSRWTSGELKRRRIRWL